MGGRNGAVETLRSVASYCSFRLRYNNFLFLSRLVLVRGAPGPSHAVKPPSREARCENMRRLSVVVFPCVGECGYPVRTVYGQACGGQDLQCTEQQTHFFITRSWATLSVHVVASPGSHAALEVGGVSVWILGEGG